MLEIVKLKHLFWDV